MTTWLNDCNDRLDGEFNTDKKLDELSLILQIELGLVEPPKLDGIEVQFAILPFLKLGNLQKIIDYIKYKRNQLKYIALTNISKKALYISTNDAEEAYKKLYQHY